jgi:hypothetical protein
MRADHVGDPEVRSPRQTHIEVTLSEFKAWNAFNKRGFRYSGESISVDLVVPGALP